MNEEVPQLHPVFCRNISGANLLLGVIITGMRLFADSSFFQPY